MYGAYCRMWWRKLSGVTSSRRKNAWTSRFWIGWYLATSLWWKNSWNVRLYFFHAAPYGRKGKAKSHFILQQMNQRFNNHFERFVRWKEYKIPTVQPTWAIAFCQSSLQTFYRTGRSSVAGSPKSKSPGLGHWNTPYRLVICSVNQNIKANRF